MLLSAGHAQAAPETPVTCGQVVAGTVKLANDLHCVESDGLVVGSDDTIIDLNGHRITCSGAGYRGSCQGTAVASAPDEEPEDGVSINGHDNVHVFTSVYGATIDGFDNGVDINRSSDVKVEHLIITGPAGGGGKPAPVQPRNHRPRLQLRRGQADPPAHRPVSEQRPLEPQPGDRDQRQLRQRGPEPGTRQQLERLRSLEWHPDQRR